MAELQASKGVKLNGIRVQDFVEKTRNVPA
jgi:hypothetical protein